MRLFQLLQLLDPELRPEQCKIHLATWNGEKDPLDVYRDGEFDEWQEWQTKKNFERPFVISLIALPGIDRWLFAGAHDSHGCKFTEGKDYQYDLDRRDGPNELDGRLILRFHRPGRQPYLDAESWADKIEVDEIRHDKVEAEKFPGYAWVRLTKGRLDAIVAQGMDSWRVALSSVSGVYVIADQETGKLYVGSATGQEGIWGRWRAYSESGHGGNAELSELLRSEGPSYAKHFQFGILEVADVRARPEYVRERETHWKQLLQSRIHGNNRN